jgi:hypothetical protein
MISIKRLFFAISLFGIMLISVPQTAMAYDFFQHAGCDQGQASSTTICTEKSNNGNPLTGCSAPDASGKVTGCGDGLLMKMTNIIAYIAGAAAIIMIIVGAIRYITSGSDVSVGSRIDDDVLNAKRSITNSLIGLAVIVLAKTIITYIIVRIH